MLTDLQALRAAIPRLYLKEFTVVSLISTSFVLSLVRITVALLPGGGNPAKKRRNVTIAGLLPEISVDPLEVARIADSG